MQLSAAVGISVEIPSWRDIFEFAPAPKALSAFPANPDGILLPMLFPMKMRKPPEHFDTLQHIMGEGICQPKIKE